MNQNQTPDATRTDQGYEPCRRRGAPYRVGRVLKCPACLDADAAL